MKKIFFAKTFVLLLGFFLMQVFSCTSSRSTATPDEGLAEKTVPVDEPSIPIEAPDLVLPPDNPDEALTWGEFEYPPDDFLSELPEITLPPEPPESVAIRPVLPEPPLFEFPLSEDALVSAEPEPAAGQAAEGGLSSSEPVMPPEQISPGTAISDLSSTSEQSGLPPSDQSSVAEIPRVRETPPEPPSFIRIPEREIAAAQEEDISAPQYNLPDSPVSYPNLEEERIVFSRTVRALAGQLIEIPFRGTGWVYLGELGSRRGVSYESRRLDPEGQIFVFRAEVPETYILKFYKQDFIRDYVLNDYVQVIVGEAPGTASGTPGWFNPPTDFSLLDQGRVTAEPRWPLIDGPGALAPSGVMPGGEVLSTAAQQEETVQSSVGPVDFSAGGGPPIAQSVTPAAVPEDFIRRAKDDFDAGRIRSALSALEEMEQLYPGMDDEALWLYAQLLEANSPNRDIRLALDCYRRLIREFPQSLRIPEAQQRIAYLERYYFNIR